MNAHQLQHIDVRPGHVVPSNLDDDVWTPVPEAVPQAHGPDKLPDGNHFPWGLRVFEYPPDCNEDLNRWSFRWVNVFVPKSGTPNRPKVGGYASLGQSALQKRPGSAPRVARLLATDQYRKIATFPIAIPFYRRKDGSVTSRIDARDAVRVIEATMAEWLLQDSKRSAIIASMGRDGTSSADWANTAARAKGNGPSSESATSEQVCASADSNLEGDQGSEGRTASKDGEVASGLTKGECSATATTPAPVSKPWSIVTKVADLRGMHVNVCLSDFEFVTPLSVHIEVFFQHQVRLARAFVVLDVNCR